MPNIIETGHWNEAFALEIYIIWLLILLSPQFLVNPFIKSASVELHRNVIHATVRVTYPSKSTTHLLRSTNLLKMPFVLTVSLLKIFVIFRSKEQKRNLLCNHLALNIRKKLGFSVFLVKEGTSPHRMTQMHSPSEVLARTGAEFPGCRLKDCLNFSLSRHCVVLVSCSICSRPHAARPLPHMMRSRGELLVLLQCTN